jgi:CheY-like chemotaxis protein
MREVVDCGVLMVPSHADWMRDWIASHGDALGRVRLHKVAFEEGAIMLASGGRAHVYAGQQADAQALSRIAMSLRRFDACMLPVTPATLGWTRTALACARTDLHTPILALARDLKAAAVQDLLALGLHDFVRDPTCPEELRARLSRLIVSGSVSGSRPGPGAAAGAGSAVGAAGGWAEHASGLADSSENSAGVHAVSYGSARTLQTTARPTYSSTLREPGAAYAATGRRHLPRGTIDSALLSMQAAARIHPDEPFRTAKSRVVDTFERDYVRTALSRHAGNVARAARASAKHRRAFWALMRKHDIDASPYRQREEDGVD